MPANKNKLLRMQTIITMLRKNEYPNFQLFMKRMRQLDEAGAFKLSSKTFSRDISDLKEEFGAPIKYDSSRRGFYLTNTEWYNEEFMIEPFEMKAALLGERVASGLFPKPLSKEVAKAVNSLLMKNESGMAEGVEPESLKVFGGDYMPNVDDEIFLSAYKAWEEHCFLQLTYCSSQNKRSEKLFEPHIFAWHSGSWYLKGREHRSNDEKYDPPKVKVLAVHRIEQAEILGCHFDPVPEILKSVNQHGLFEFNTIPEVTMRFSHPFNKVIYERFKDKQNVKIEEYSKNIIKISLMDIPQYEALNLLFLARHRAEILEPQSLRSTVCRIANGILTHHRGQ